MSESPYEMQELQSDQRRLAAMFRDQFRDFSQQVTKMTVSSNNQNEQLKKLFTEQSNFIRETNKKMDEFERKLNDMEKDMDKMVKSNTRVIESHRDVNRQTLNMAKDIQHLKNKVR